MTKILQMVREGLGRMRLRLSPEELALGQHLRTNDKLYEDLRTFINLRINSRAALPPPASPVDCAMSMARDHELRQVLARLDTIKRAPVAEQDSEHPDQGPQG